MNIKVSDLWTRNYREGSWCAFLHDEFLKGGLGKHFDTIRFWMEEFKSGKTTTIIVDYEGMVADGNHRLVAAKLQGIAEIGFERPSDDYIYNTG